MVLYLMPRGEKYVYWNEDEVFSCEREPGARVPVQPARRASTLAGSAAYSTLAGSAAYSTPATASLSFCIATTYAASFLQINRLLADGREPCELLRVFRRRNVWAAVEAVDAPRESASLLALTTKAKIADGRRAQLQAHQQRASQRRSVRK